MSFLWTRSAGALVSRCVLCGHVITSRHEPTLLKAQRGHDWLTCQLRRAAVARAAAPEGQAEARRYAGNNMLNRLAESGPWLDGLCCGTTVFGVVPGVETGRLGSGNNEPASAQTLTGSSTPLVTTRKEA